MKWETMKSYWEWPKYVTPDLVENFMNAWMRNCRIGKVTMKEGR